MGKERKKYEELTIIDDFMFGKVMRDPARCKRMLEIILGIRIREVVFLEDQETLKPDYEAKGIRLDIFLQDSKQTVYNVEMQAWDTGSLPKRSRYYQSVLDINLIEKGSDYNSLKKSYVIFICTFDLFGQGRHIYHFENRCREDPELCLGDGAQRIFLNTAGTMDDVDGDLRSLLDYFRSLEPQDAYTKELDAAVADARQHREWRREYMKLRAWEQDIRREERAEGKAEGRTEGELLTLINLVCKKLEKGRSADEIAEDLEENIEKIQRICNVVRSFAPDYDRERILAELLPSEKAGKKG